MRPMSDERRDDPVDAADPTRIVVELTDTDMGVEATVHWPDLRGTGSTDPLASWEAKFPERAVVVRLGDWVRENVPTAGVWWPREGAYLAIRQERGDVVAVPGDTLQAIAGQVWRSGGTEAHSIADAYRAALTDPTPTVQAWPMEDPPGNGPVSDAGTRSAQGHRGGPESGSDAAGRADRWVGAVVTTGEELDALPDGSAIGLVRRGEFRAFRKSGERWEDERGVRFDEDWLPVRLLYVGEWQGDE